MIVDIADYGKGTYQVIYLDLSGEAIISSNYLSYQLTVFPCFHVYDNFGVYTPISGKKHPTSLLYLEKV